MNVIRYTILRSVLAIAAGTAIVLWPQAAVIYLVILTGILFTLSGAWSLGGYCIVRNRKEKEQAPAFFPFEGAGSALFGILLIVMPGFFVHILMYILGALLVIAGLQQLLFLFKAREYVRVGAGFHVLPALILVTGILILAYPFESASNTFVLFGVTGIIYGINELVNGYKFRRTP
jgi:uncharacterized membrane protein HdeD (DUF308 family)